MRKGWEYKKLGDCFSYIKNGANIKQKKDADGFPITRIETLSGGVFNRDRMGYAGIHDLSKYADYVLESKDLLMSHINSKTYIGRTVEYKGNNEETIIHGMNLLRLKAIHELIDSTFFAYYTQSGDFKSKIARIRKDAVNQSSFAISDLKRFDIPLPPKSTQLAIVSELDKINELIRLKKEQLKDFDNLAQSLFYEMFGDPVENEKGWEVKKLGEVCEVTSAKRVFIDEVVESGVPFIRGTELTALSKLVPGEKMDYTLFITYEHYERLKAITGVPKIGDLLIPSINADGIVWMVDTEDPLYFKDGRVLWVHVNHEYYNSIAIQKLMNVLIKNVFTSMGGATFAELKLFVLRNMNVPTPPLSVQDAFSEKIKQIDAQKLQVKKSIQDLETLLASRMQYWFE